MKMYPGVNVVHPVFIKFIFIQENLHLNPAVCGRRAQMLHVPGNDSFNWVDSSEQIRLSESNYFFFIRLN